MLAEREKKSSPGKLVAYFGWQGDVVEREKTCL